MMIDFFAIAGEIPQPWSTLLAYGLAFPLLVFCLKWLEKDRDKVLVALQEERQHRIKALEESAEHCLEDRDELRAEMANLRNEVRGLYTQIINMRESSK